ncbi:vacuolar protein sorting-associated protein, putative [Phytophthora infestans T30-4]|uniref:Vacuolar protein sorting-associated protein, putative n=1 Tax=Phytophthora infestans (strain T30-4) TaxID=403677 RepID=D0NLJ7_PHYIT|nr:vacuolar protein sorting-associated protein, putative [Phytophthora infestans T30-4]EEY60544.1 vacuolar protein sorting-associated protein, putative [Phytophthora infestans T30-4]|eukprot:XP_002899917.1 vacuolar protein sorting-associated protein, putative [Phytophthora infestans T30-4]
MVKLPSLDRGVLPLQKLRDEYVRALTHLLDHLGTDRVSLVLSKRLAALLTHVFIDGLGVLKSHHVVECLELADDHVTADTTVVYLTFARTGDARAVAAHADKLLEHGDDERRKRRLALYVVGKWTTMLDQALDYGRVRGRFQTGELSMGFFPLDTDLLTLGFRRTLYECGVEGNRSSLVDMAAALNLLQQVYGKFNSIKYKGEMSMLVLNHLMEMNAGGSGMMSSSGNATTGPPTGAQRSRLDTLILLDRSVDFASVFSTPLTFEAVLDEVMSIQDGFIMASPQILRADDSASNDLVPVAMNSTDEIFQMIRDKHIHTIPAALNAQAVRVKQRFTEFQRVSGTATAAEVNEFVKTVPQMKASQQSIEQHINLLEYLETTTSSKPFRDLWQLERKIVDRADGVLDTIEELIYRHEDLRKVLRLLCLYCVVNDGMTRHDLERLKVHVVRTYGHELIFSFSILDRLRVLYERQPRSFLPDDTGCSFHYVTQSLSVIDVDVNIKNPKNAAFVTSGYAPISARLVEEILKHGHWRGIDHVMSRLHGPRAEVHLSENDRSDKEDNKVKSKKKTVVVVAFVGGVTFLEIAALRWIASFYPIELVVASTSIINGKMFISELLGYVPPTTA